MSNTRLEASVAIIGAGLAGLTAARALRKNGYDVVVVEARNRAGGRLLPFSFSDGTRVDLGGQWHGPGHHRLRALSKEFGIASLPTFTSGKTTFQLRGRIGRYRAIPPVNPLALIGTGLALARLGRLAKSFATTSSWDSPRAVELDAQSLGEWIDRHVRPASARALIRLSLETLYCCHPEDVSLLHALFSIAHSGDISQLLNVEGGAQEQHFEGGTSQLLNRIVGAMDGCIRYGLPVRRIEHHDDHATVFSDGLEISARRVVITVPPPKIASIAFSPKLEPERSRLLARMSMGSVVKCVALYERPFWRARGLSGQVWSDQGPVKVIYDTSSPSTSKGILTAFAEAADAEELRRMEAGERRRVVLRAIARMLGSEGESPLEYVDLVWSDEEWTGGGYSAHAQPGAFAGAEAPLRRPFGVLHWAGTETASSWPGYMEGAIESGERAAREVTASLAA